MCILNWSDWVAFNNTRKARSPESDPGATGLHVMVGQRLDQSQKCRFGEIKMGYPTARLNL